MVPTNVLHAVIGRLHQFRFCSFPEYSANLIHAQHSVGADAYIGPRSMYHFNGNLRRIRRFPTGRCGHRPLQTFTIECKYRRTRRCVLHCMAGCFATFLRGNCYRWEHCLHAGGAVVQLCREIPVCWPQCFSTGLFCGLRYNPIRIQAPLFAHFFWQGRKSGSAKQRLRSRRKKSSSGANWKGRANRAVRPYKLLCRITRGATAAVPPQKRQSGESG